MYDVIIDLLSTLWRHGFSVTALGTAVFVLLKQKKIKKKLLSYVPWLLEEDSEVKPYIENQKQIMANQKLIMERLGIECVPTLTNYSKSSVMKKERSSLPLATMLLPARYAKKYMKSGGKKMLKKLKQRKFILAVVGATLIIANDGFDLGIDSETVFAFAGLIATWIAGESVVDAKRSSNSNDGSEYHN